MTDCLIHSVTKCNLSRYESSTYTRIHMYRHTRTRTRTHFIFIYIIYIYIYIYIYNIPMPSANVYNAHARVILSPLLAFQPASLEEVTSLIQNGKIKTSNIDPLPSAILKANTSILAPILRSIINLSYESSTVPASMKHAVITPLLKRSGLSTDDYSSYRPISNLPY